MVSILLAPLLPFDRRKRRMQDRDDDLDLSGLDKLLAKPTMLDAEEVAAIRETVAYLLTVPLDAGMTWCLRRLQGILGRTPDE